MKHFRLSTFAAMALLSIALGPAVLRSWDLRRELHRLDALGLAGESSARYARLRFGEPSYVSTPDPALVVRVQETGGLVASWQTVGGCGAGSGGGSGVGLKWIGRNVRGGLFNVQEQLSYTKIGAPGYPEYNFFSNTLINTDLGEKWNVGINLPFVYKYLVDPTHVGGPGNAPVDYTNAGIGDINLLCTRKLGRINALALTGTVGIPTGAYDARFTPKGTPINQSQQIGFGEPTASLGLDQTFDKVWGLVVVGGVGSWRGGTNKVANYRSPSASSYGYIGYFLGPLVPAFGLAVTGYKDHDRDQDTPQRTPLLSFAANLSIEWSTDWIALLVAASIPYGYDGIKKDESGLPRSPWGFLPWTATLGIAASPF